MATWNPFPASLGEGKGCSRVDDLALSRPGSVGRRLGLVFQPLGLGSGAHRAEDLMVQGRFGAAGCGVNTQSAWVSSQVQTVSVGLTLVQRLTQAMGGRVSLRDAEPGVEFFIGLQRAAPP